MIGGADMANKKGKKLKEPLNSLLLKNHTKKDIRSVNSGFGPDQRLGYYLAGLIEGDGYISITNKNCVILGITFNIKDKPLAEKLKKYLEKAYIVKRETNSIELRISAVKTLKTLIKIINGKFRTPKIDQLYKLIDWMNKNHSMKIEKLPIDNSSLHDNSWLAGFIDADGCFYIRYSLKQIICKFNLEQRMIYPKTKESYE